MNLSLSTHPPACTLIFSQTLLRGLRRWALSLAMLAFALLTTFAQAPAAGAQSAPPQFLFSQTSTNGASTITTYTVDPTTGVPTPIAAPPTQPREQVGLLAVNPAVTFLFNTTLNSANSAAIAVFSIAADGSTSEIPASPFALSNTTARPVALTVGRDGRYLYVLSFFEADAVTALIDVFSIGSDGSLAVINSYTIAPALPTAMFMHPTGRWLYVYCWYNQAPNDDGAPDFIQQYDMNFDGTLTTESLTDLEEFSAPSLSMTGSNDGALIFAGHGMVGSSDSFLDSFFVDSVTGNPTEVSRLDIQNGNGSNPAGTGNDGMPTNLVVDSTNTYLYSNAGSFTFPNGVVTQLALPSAYPLGSPLLISQITPFLYSGSNNTSVVNQVHADGSLSPVASPLIGTVISAAITGLAPAPTEPILRPNFSAETLSAVVGQPNVVPIIVTNWGYATLTVSNASIAGDPSFTITNNMCTTPISPMGTCEVDVSFNPTAPGTFTSTLTLESNSPTQTVAFTGNAQNPRPPRPDPGILPSQQIILPDTVPGTTSNVTVQLANAMDATAPLTVSGITFTGSNPGDFSQTNTCTAPIPANGSCSITITFNPQAMGNRAAVLTIASNAQDFSGGTVSGNAVASVTKFSLTTSTSGTGSIQQSPAGSSFGSNTTITLTAVPSGNNVEFGSWSGGPCAGNGNNPCVFQITANTAAAATFIQQFTVTTVVVGAGSVSPGGVLNFPANTSISLSAIPLPGASFVSWSGVCPGSTNPTCIFTVTANVTATATFTTQQVTLGTNIVGPGTIQQTPAGTTFTAGTAIKLTATPNTGASFVNWSGACVGSTSPVCNFTINNNTQGAATFSAGAQVSLATSVVGPGTIQQSPTGSSFTSGTSITLTAVPNVGASFTSWTGPCAGSANPVCTFAINANTIATAAFTAGVQFTLSTSVVGPGTIQQSPTGTSFVSGTSITLTAMPGANAVFTSWTGPCAGSTNPVCTFAISANTTASATFTQQFTLTTTVVGPGTIQQAPTGTSFASGTSITLTAVPNAGATFTSWAGACAGSTTAACAFSITANTTATATFTAAPMVTPSQPTQMGSAGTAFTFPITTSGFTAPPTLTASCSIPEGTCTISGSTLTVITTARTAGAVRSAAVSFPPMASSSSASSLIAPEFARLRATKITFAPLRSPLLALFVVLAIWLVMPASAASPRLRRTLRPLAMLAVLCLVAGCGGGGSSPPPVNGTPAGTYRITITATSGAQTATSIVTVVVQ
jgi:uncharacterized repeat protein (TIGR02543 family)